MLKLPKDWILAVLVTVLVGCGAFAGTTTAAGESYNSHGKRDPFLLTSQTASGVAGEGKDVDTSALEAWFNQNLGGVVWDPKNPYALIGDEIVPVGAEVRGCTIVEIKPGGIVFSYGQKRVEVPLKEYKQEGKKKGER